MKKDKDKDKDQEKKEEQGQRGMTRRSFLGTVGASAVGVAASATLLKEQKAQAQEVKKANEEYKVTLNVNGRKRTLLVEPRWSLQFVLNAKLGLTATKEGCGRGECGACTVLINDIPRYACQTLALEAEGTKITTLEGLMKGENLGPVQEAFLKEDGLQCGYCTPGQVMAAEGLLRANRNPSPEEITRAMSGNICRCAAYPNIFRAVKLAAQLRK
jgi:xanthine dehydrogenase YagT iron-sulfur-binding subunit